ncbi:MAG: hypothetical protein GF401_14900 [Chitinivibrionales bacterium]|nr:hypothetical protein [Chitinivibrionales bacterium]
MPRKRRISIPGAVHHIISRGIDGREIFIDDNDRRFFIARIGRLLQENNYRCYAWALMSNHYHFLIRTSTVSLSRFMRKLNTTYAMYFNKRHTKQGYVYQDRYRSRICQERVYFLELVRYIHLNPVRGGVVKNLKELESYPWCGHGGIVGYNKPEWQQSGEVLARFCKSRKNAIQAYLSFMQEGLEKDTGLFQEDIYIFKDKQAQQSNKAVDDRIIGDRSFIEEVLHKAKLDHEKEKLISKVDKDIRQVAEWICRSNGIKMQDLLRKGRMNSRSKARETFCFKAHSLGITMKEIADFLGIGVPSVSKLYYKGLEEGKE